MGTVQEPSRAFSSCHGVSSSAFAETTISLSENTKPVLQIVNQRELGVAVQDNQPGTVPNGIGKQVMAAKNLYDQYITRNGFTPIIPDDLHKRACAGVDSGIEKPLFESLLTEPLCAFY